jgi:nucleotide-binding universal stress UspA family protein
MLRSILVALDESAWSETATRLSLDWAVRSRARVIGLGIVDEPFIVRGELVPRGAAEYKARRDQARLADAHKRVAGMLGKFRARCSSAGIEANGVKEVGDSTQCILKYAHSCDLVILGRETYFHFETQDKSDETLGQVLRGNPRPTVGVPRELRDGSGVLVAYGAGREVARTLQTVQLLGLACDEITHLVTVRRPGANTDSSAGLAADFLKYHGAAYQLHDVQSELSPAEALLEQVETLRPRLLVMGAQGYHPVRDLFVTSVTRAVLRACPVPVLVGA